MHPKVREIWWVRIGVNIGSEIYGKGNLHLRPVLVINTENPESFIGLPLTSKIKSRKHSMIIKTEDGSVHRVLLSQVRLFDNRRLWRRKYILDIDQYSSIKNLFSDLYKIQ